MQALAPSAVRSAARHVDAWSVLTGASVGIVAGFAVDLLRLGLHETRRAWASVGARHRSAPPARDWRCPRSCG